MSEREAFMTPVKACASGFFFFFLRLGQVARERKARWKSIPRTMGHARSVEKKQTHFGTLIWNVIASILINPYERYTFAFPKHYGLSKPQGCIVNSKNRMAAKEKRNVECRTATIGRWTMRNISLLPAPPLEL